MIKLTGVVLLFFLLFWLQRAVYTRLWHKSLTADIHFSREHIFAGEQCTLKEVIQNRKRLPLPILKVKFKTDRHLAFGDSTEGSRTTDQFYRNDVFRIGGGEKVTRTLKLTGGRRGFYTIEDVSMVASDLFMTRQMVKQLPARAELYVYPRPYDSAEFRRSLTRLNGEVLSKRHLLEDPFEYRGIREYQPFDDMRSINWKATAKTGALKVNQKNYTSLKSIRIFFNIQDDNIMKREDCVEASLEITAGLCAFFLNQGIQTSCHGNGLDIRTRKPLSIEARAGAGQLDAIYRGLARLDLTQTPAGFTDTFEERLFSGSGSSITCFVAPNQYDDFLGLLEKYGEAGNEFYWFYPLSGSGEPKLPDTIRKQVRFIHISG